MLESKHSVNLPVPIFLIHYQIYVQDQQPPKIYHEKKKKSVCIQFFLYDPKYRLFHSIKLVLHTFIAGSCDILRDFLVVWQILKAVAIIWLFTVFIDALIYH